MNEPPTCLERIFTAVGVLTAAAILLSQNEVARGVLVGCLIAIVIVAISLGWPHGGEDE
jgi:hypothetical protein